MLGLDLEEPRNSAEQAFRHLCLRFFLIELCWSRLGLLATEARLLRSPIAMPVSLSRTRCWLWR